MSRRRPVSRQAVLQVLVALGVLFLVVLGTTWIQRSGPTVDRSPTPQLDEGLPETELITCERTLPSADEETDEEEAIVGPVGRVTSEAANSCPRRFDGRLVSYVGEVVGDVLRRDGGAWVLMNDDGYALDVGPLPAHREWAGTNAGLAVWLPDELLPVVHVPGRRGVRGDVLEIEGIFQRQDPTDGGGLSIRAVEATLVSAAKEIDQPLHVPQLIAAGIAAAAAIGLTIRERAVRRAR